MQHRDIALFDIDILRMGIACKRKHNKPSRDANAPNAFTRAIRFKPTSLTSIDSIGYICRLAVLNSGLEGLLDVVVLLVCPLWLGCFVVRLD